MESNHDPQMLMESNRPFFLKQRIMAMDGHLCNMDAAEVLAKVVSHNTKEVTLAHLSEEANCPDLAVKTTINKLNNNKIKIRAAKQFEIVSGGEYAKK